MQRSPYRGRTDTATATLLLYFSRSCLIRLMDSHSHGRSCACPHHHKTEPSGSRAGWWSAVLPILACAICPGCIATYAKVLSALGVGFALTESQHLWLLAICVLVSIAIGFREVRTTRRPEPLVLTLLGCVVLVGVHRFAEDTSWARLTWLGVAFLLAGALWGHRVRLAQARHHAPPEGGDMQAGLAHRPEPLQGRHSSDDASSRVHHVHARTPRVGPLAAVAKRAS
jgi:hypothetical protein